MRIINFIKPLPPERERELRIWYRIALSSFVGIILLGATVTSIQLYLFINLYRTKKSVMQQLAPFNAAVAQQKTDRTQQEILQQQTARLERYIKDPKNPVHIIAAIISAAKDLQLQAFNITSKAIEVQISAPSPESVLALMERLSGAMHENALVFGEIQLASLSAAGQQIQATIKAVPIRGLRIGKYDRTAKS